MIGKEKLFEYTGNIAFAGFTAPKIMWLRDNEPENFTRISKIMLPKESAEQEPITVRKQHLDTNHHVNNVQYVRMAKAFLPEEFPIVKMRAEYKKQALLGDVLMPYVACTKEDGQEKWTVSLQDAQRGIFVNVEFEGKCK